MGYDPAFPVRILTLDQNNFEHAVATQFLCKWIQQGKLLLTPWNSFETKSFLCVDDAPKTMPDLIDTVRTMWIEDQIKGTSLNGVLAQRLWKEAECKVTEFIRTKYQDTTLQAIDRVMFKWKSRHGGYSKIAIRPITASTVLRWIQDTHPFLGDK